MAANQRRVDQEEGVSNTKCQVPSCRLAGPATCAWKMHTIEEGERVYTGKACGLRLCAVHVRTVNGKHLCLWHATKADQLLAEMERT